MKFKSIFILFCLVLGTPVHAGLVLNESEQYLAMNQIAEKTVSPKIVQGISAKVYDAKSGDYISFIVAVDKGIDGVRSSSEYIGFTFSDASGRMNIFVDKQKMPATLVKIMNEKKYINDAAVVNQILQKNFDFEVHKRELLINFSKEKRGIASKE